MQTSCPPRLAAHANRKANLHGTPAKCFYRKNSLRTPLRQKQTNQGRKVTQRNTLEWRLNIEATPQRAHHKLRKEGVRGKYPPIVSQFTPVFHEWRRLGTRALNSAYSLFQLLFFFSGSCTNFRAVRRIGRTAMTRCADGSFCSLTVLVSSFRRHAETPF